MGSYNTAKKLKIFEMIIDIISGLYCLVFSAFMTVLFLLGSGLVYVWYLKYDDEVGSYLRLGIGYGIATLVALAVFILFLVLCISCLKGFSKMQKGIDPVITYKKCKARQVFDIVLTGFMMVFAPAISLSISPLNPNVENISAEIAAIGFAVSVFEAGALVLAIISLSLFKKGTAQVYGSALQQQ